MGQMQLEDASGVAQTIISDMENNPEARRQAKTENRLASALEITPADLKRPPRDDEWRESKIERTGLEEFRLRGGQNLSPEMKGDFKRRLDEEIQRRRAERQRLERIQQLEEEERELERIRKDLGNGNESDTPHVP